MDHLQIFMIAQVSRRLGVWVASAQVFKFLQEGPRTSLHLIVLCATTGDTGIAAAEGRTQGLACCLLLMQIISRPKALSLVCPGQPFRDGCLT